MSLTVQAPDIHHLEEHSTSLQGAFSQATSYPRYTIVADGDWTLYKASSHEDTFGSSPARDATLAWIRSGIKTDALGMNFFSHQLVLSTGGDFNMAEQRFLMHLPEDIKPAVTLVTNSGARLFYYDIHGKLIEDTHYISHGIEGGVCITEDIEKDFIDHAVALINIFFSELKTNPQLQKEAEQAPYGAYIKQLAQKHPESGFTLEEFQTRIVHGASKEQLFPRIEIREICKGSTVQISIMGIFSNLPSLKTHAEFQKHLTHLDSYPNTILSQNLCVLEMSRTDKGTALHYLGINPECSVGIGDSPDGNDQPLTQYKAGSYTMPFISVAKTAPKNIPELPHIGHEVEGTKRFFESLLEEHTAHPTEPFIESIRKAELQAHKLLK